VTPDCRTFSFPWRHLRVLAIRVDESRAQLNTACSPKSTARVSYSTRMAPWKRFVRTGGHRRLVFLSREKFHRQIALAAGILPGGLFAAMRALDFHTCANEVRIRKQSRSGTAESEARYRHLTEAAFEGIASAKIGASYWCEYQFA